MPGKVLKMVAGEPMLGRIVNRAAQSNGLNSVIVATSKNSADDMIEDFCKQRKIPYFRGSQENVLERYYQCAKQYQGDIIIRLTADNVFVDSVIIEEAIRYFQSKEQLDYLYYREGLPLGLAVEVFSMKALERTFLETKNLECQEHVTLYMYRNPELFHCIRVKSQEDYSFLRLTMDTEQDYQMITSLYERLLEKGLEISYKNVISELLQDEKLRKMNQEVVQKAPKYRLNDNKQS